jgi:hypothetical protein
MGARPGQTTMTVSNIVANTNTAISKSISDSFWYRRALEDGIFARGSQARRGVGSYYDSVTRQTYELSNSGYKWINASGQIITTTTQNPPAPGFRPLEHVEPR